jgi:AcrR family transcriptional regulator
LHPLQLSREEGYDQQVSSAPGTSTSASSAADPVPTGSGGPTADATADPSDDTVEPAPATAEPVGTVAADPSVGTAAHPGDDPTDPESSRPQCNGQQGEGLRERKKRRARSDMHRAALELVADQGLAGVTVEMISERAGVSPRTFFNHWSTKETAILGISIDEASDLVALYRQRPEQEGAREALRNMMREGAATAENEQDLRDLKKRVMKREPQLHAISAGRTARTQIELVAAYEERLLRDESRESEQGDGIGGSSLLDPHARAVVAVQLAFALMHSAFILSMSHGTSLSDEFDELLSYEDSELLRF